MNKKLTIVLVAFVLLLLAACSPNEQHTPNVENGGSAQKIAIYTTVYPLQYFTERIGGDHITVQSIYPAGTDEHIFEPTQKDMMALADSDLFFYIGLGLEGFVDNAVTTLKDEHVKMIATGENISAEMLDEVLHVDDDHGHEHGPFDPHVWMSPTLSVELAASIKEALVVEVPAFKDEFEQNFEQLHADLLELDNKFKELAANATTKTFFVSHAAFGYIASPYGLEQIAIAGLNSQNEPSQKQLTKIVEEAKENNIQYVFFEQNVSSKLTDVVRKEIGAESLILHNLGVLTPEDLQNEETYFTLMEQNIQALQQALHG